ncbi:hypothetical protein HHI36_015327 [Cryptolaemus montrouzieri]|uniref:Protein sleepless n=1 Tax=Cryptolaemus montrouzieri TaxID=559131 RepID=A0ABD2N6M2_9CUCU
MNRILASALLIVCAISSGYCLECYTCDSSQSMWCNVGLLSFFMPTEDCSKQGGDSILTSWVPKECVKLTAKDSEGKEFVARGCIPYVGGACNIVMKTLGFFSELSGGARDVNCYTCSGNKCNSSFTIRPSVAATVLLTSLFMFFRL